MDYIQGISAQAEIFLYSLGFGFLLGILYDVFRTVRKIISDSGAFVFFMDFLYFAVCAFLIFCFNLVVDSGRIRIYVMLGHVLGWLIYYFSFGAVAVRVSNAVTAFLRRIFSPLTRFFGFLIRKVKATAINFKKTIKNLRKK